VDRDGHAGLGTGALKLYDTTACLGKWEYENHPEAWHVVVKAEKANLAAMLAADKAAIVGKVTTSEFWARGVGHRWVRTPKRLATTRVMRLSVQGEAPARRKR
jgi:hypothetical protein